MFEMFFVFVVLAVVAFFSGNRLVEWVGVFAVLLTFAHATVANRMSERQALMLEPDVECYKWSDRYFVAKELLWFSYFLLHRSYAALVGVFIFLLYPFWRRLYRKMRPLNRR